MSSATAALRPYAVPCPACGAATPLEGGGPETVRRTCAACGSQLVILRTDSLFMMTIPSQQKRGSAAPETDADSITELWGALDGSR